MIISPLSDAPGNGAARLRAGLHIGKPLDGFGEVLQGFLVPLPDGIQDAVPDVSLQHHLAHFVQGAFGGVELGEDILAGNLLVDHPVDSLDLTQDLGQPAVEIIRVHAFFQSFLQGAAFLCPGTFGSVHIPGKAQGDESRLFFPVDPAQVLQELVFVPGGQDPRFPRQETGGVGDGVARPGVPVIDGHDAHGVSPLFPRFSPL